MATAVVDKFGAVLAQINTLRIRQTELQAIVEQSHADERRARIEAIDANPNERSDASGARSDVGKILKFRRDSETALVGLSEELEACAVVFERLKTERADEQLARIADEVAELDAAEVQHVARLTDGLEALLVEWNALIRFYEDRQQTAFLDGEFVDHAAGDVAMSNGRAPSLSPTPMDFLGLVEMLYEVTCDPRGLGVRDGQPVALNGTAFQNWLEATRDLREWNAVNVVPPNARPRYSSGKNPAAHGGAGQPAIQWRDSAGNLPADSRVGWRS